MSFFKKLFATKQLASPNLPRIMGLRLSASFEIDDLYLKLLEPYLTISKCARTQIINAVGYVDLDGTYMFRFYTDDEGYLQVVAEGGKEEANIVDVKMYHYFDTQDIQSESTWNDLLNNKIGQPTYTLNGYTYTRVWTSNSEYHNPVAMSEKTYDTSSTSGDDFDSTDQFTMLFERVLDNGDFESLYLSAEERVNSHDQLDRSLVISTGITISPTNIKIHG